MFNKYSWLFLLFNYLAFSESAFVDTLTKCSIDDAECHKKLLQKIITDISKTGVSELGIPPIDPMKLENITISIPDVLDITLIEGQVKGIKNCVIDKNELVIEDEHAFMEVTCDVTIKGKYKVFSASQVLKNLLNGQTVHGEGNGKVKIEKLKLKFDFPVYIIKRDGKLYIKYEKDKTKYDVDVKEKMTFFADNNIYVGDVESSKLILGMLNENWKNLMGSFGKPFFKKAVMVFFDVLDKFFNNVALEHYIIGDLSGYIKEE